MWSVFWHIFLFWGLLIYCIYPMYVGHVSFLMSLHWSSSSKQKNSIPIILNKEVDICDNVSHDSYQYPRRGSMATRWTLVRDCTNIETHLLCCHTWYGYVWLSIRHQKSTYQNKISYFNIIDPFIHPASTHQLWHLKMYNSEAWSEG